MPMRRINSTTVEDEYGNQYFAPDEATLSAGQAEMGTWPTDVPSPTFNPQPLGPPNGPPSPSDPTAALMNPSDPTVAPAPWEQFVRRTIEDTGLSPHTVSPVGQRLHEMGELGYEGDGPSFIAGSHPGTSSYAPHVDEGTPESRRDEALQRRALYATAEQPSAQQGPQVPGMPTVGGMPVTSGQAEKAVGDGFNDYSRLAGQSAEAQFAAARSEAERVAAAAERGVAERDRIAAENERMYQAHAQKADQDTAEWLREQQRVSETRVDPKRAFHSKDAFGKLAWVISLITGAAASGGDASKNIALKMLHDEMEQDIDLQKGEIERKMGAVNAKGQALAQRQGRDLAQLKDRATEKWQRLDAVEKHLLAQAKIPGSEHRQAALLQTAELMAKEKMAVLEKRAVTAHANERAAAERALEQARLQESRRAAFAREKHDRDQLAEQKRQHGVDDQTKRDLAQMSISAQSADAAAKAGQADKDQRTLSPNSGFRIVGPAGEVMPVQTDKTEYAKVADIATASVKRHNAYAKMHKLLSQGHGDGASWLIASDEQINAAINEAIGPIAKEIDPSGKLSDSDMARAGLAYLGVDSTSFWGKVKGPERTEMLKLINDKMEELPAKAAMDVEIATGRPLPAGARVMLTPPDLNAKDAPTPTTDEELEPYGVKPTPKTHPKDKADYLKRVKGKKPMADLPPDLGKRLKEYEDKMAKFPGKRRELAAAAAAHVDAWLATNDDPWSGKTSSLTPDEQAKIREKAQEAARHARIRVDAMADDGGRNSGFMAETVAAATAAAAISGKDPRVTIDELARKNAVELTPEELDALVKQVKARLPQR